MIKFFKVIALVISVAHLTMFNFKGHEDSDLLLAILFVLYAIFWQWEEDGKD